jgi:hypothetical protein
MYGHELPREFEVTGESTAFGAVPFSGPESDEIAQWWYPGQPAALAAVLTGASEARERDTSDAEIEAVQTVSLGEFSPVDEAELFIDEATDGAGEGLDATRARIGPGIFDENELTDLVFLGRHGERLGLLSTPEEPGYADLLSEWLAMRDTIVRPALRRARPAGARYDGDGGPTSSDESGGPNALDEQLGAMLDEALADGAAQADVDALLAAVPQGDATEGIQTYVPHAPPEPDDQESSARPPEELA